MLPLHRILTFLLFSGFLHAQTAPATNQPASENQSDKRATAISNESRDPLLDLPTLPRNRVTLLGGLVTNMDAITNRISVRPFGAKRKITVNFDVRTHFYLEGQPATERALRDGQRVYVDTMLNGDKVFAKSVWIQTSATAGSGRGQVVSYDRGSGVLTLRDELSAMPETFHLTPATIIKNGTQTSSVSDLEPGSLVALTFGVQDGMSGVVQEVTLLARPGAEFTFSGKVTFIDLSKKMIALDNETDNKNYEVYFESLPATMLQNLREGSQVAISAVFNGTHYVARKFDMAQAHQP
ncbi:MAG: hypothetical protein QOD84_1657 [Acidobacteriaceae bacterium]|jgi:hypothetical protein